MNSKSKFLIYLLILGFFAILNGSYLKLNGNHNADIMLACGLIMKTISIIGLIVVNFKKLQLLFK